MKNLNFNKILLIIIFIIVLAAPYFIFMDTMPAGIIKTDLIKKCDAPSITSTKYVSDNKMEISGTGTAGFEIHLIGLNGESMTALIGKDGKWTLSDVNEIKTMFDKVYIYQSAQGKLSSEYVFIQLGVITDQSGKQYAPTYTEKIWEVLLSDSKSKEPKEYLYDPDDSIKKQSNKNGDEVSGVVKADGNFVAKRKMQLWQNLFTNKWYVGNPDGTKAANQTYMADISDSPLLNHQDTTFYIAPIPGYLRSGDSYLLKLFFEDSVLQSDYENGKLKMSYFSSNNDAATVADDGMVTLVAPNPSAGYGITFTVVAPDGSMKTAGFTFQPDSVLSSSTYHIAAVNNSNMSVYANTNILINTTYTTKTSITGSVANLKSISYAVSADPSSTGSVVTPDGLFKSGSKGGAVSVTVTAVDKDGLSYTGTITVTVTDPSTITPDDNAVSFTGDWTTLEPAAAFSSGTGTALKPYKISSVRQLKKLATDMAILGGADATYGKHFTLTTDLDFSGTTGVTSLIPGAFCGTFNGGNHVIKNLSIDTDKTHAGNIFGGIGYGEVKNLGREGGTVKANSYVGAIADYINYGAKFSNVYNATPISGGYCGGMVSNIGYYGAVIENCYNTGAITGNSSGGLVGYTIAAGGNAKIIGSYNTGKIQGTSTIGGIIGYIHAGSATAVSGQTVTLENVSNYGNVVRSGGTNAAIGSIIGSINTPVMPFINVNFNNVQSNLGAVLFGAVPQNNRTIGSTGTGNINITGAPVEVADLTTLP